MSEERPTSWQSPAEPDGATPLTEEEKEGLRLSWVATRADLDLAEATNIATALLQPRWRRCSTVQLLDDLSVPRLHAAMFGDVWSWAGKYRTTERNVGCDPQLIAVKVRDLCRDAQHWFGGSLPSDLAGCMVHHRLVAIHPFANGNGRHSREFTDLLMRSVASQPFTWGSANLIQASQTRRAYIAALRAADRGEYDALLAFVRS